MNSLIHIEHNGFGKISLTIALFTLILSGALSGLIYFEAGYPKVTVLLCFLLPVFVPLMAYYSLKIGIWGLKIDGNKIFSILGISISALLLLAALILWSYVIRLFIAIDAVSGSGIFQGFN